MCVCHLVGVGAVSGKAIREMVQAAADGEPVRGELSVSSSEKVKCTGGRNKDARDFS